MSPGTPFLAPDPEREESELRRMDQPPYELDVPRRQIVLNAIREVAEYRGWELLAAHVRTTHVHVVVTSTESPERVMNDFKGYASRRLNEAGFENAERKRWTRHGSTPYLWKPRDVEAAVHYVVHEQGEPMAVFDRSGEDRSLTLAARIGAARIYFEIFAPKSESEVRGGTVTRGNAVCPCCHAVLPVARVRDQLRAQRGGADVIFDDNGGRIGGAASTACRPSATTRPCGKPRSSSRSSWTIGSATNDRPSAPCPMSHFHHKGPSAFVSNFTACSSGATSSPPGRNHCSRCLLTRYGDTGSNRAEWGMPPPTFWD